MVPRPSGARRAMPGLRGRPAGTRPGCRRCLRHRAGQLAGSVGPRSPRRRPRWSADHHRARRHGGPVRVPGRPLRLGLPPLLQLLRAGRAAGLAGGVPRAAARRRAAGRLRQPGAIHLRRRLGRPGGVGGPARRAVLGRGQPDGGGAAAVHRPRRSPGFRPHAGGPGGRAARRRFRIKRVLRGPRPWPPAGEIPGDVHRHARRQAARGRRWSGGRGLRASRRRPPVGTHSHPPADPGSRTITP